jgi:hypothetical protein
VRPSNQEDLEPVAVQGSAARVSVVTGPAGSGDGRSLCRHLALLYPTPRARPIHHRSGPIT